MDVDYIIVGAGSAGCVLAHRLSEDPDCQVLLLEAGSQAADRRVPIPGAAPKLEGTPIDWAFRTEPQPALMDRRIDYPRGRCLGGSSAINYCAYVRGNRGDYDHWGQLGNTGWYYESVLPYFRRAEANADLDDAFHGTDGPLSVESYSQPTELHEIYLDANEAVGLPRNPDFNGEKQEGCGYYQATLRDGRRCDTATAYLTPALERENLKVSPGCLITGIVFEKRRAVGVRYLEGGRESVIARASAEVILSAGSIGSPQILMLSGVGPADHLAEHGIALVHDLPVGTGLVDHLGRAPVSMTVREPERFGFDASGFDSWTERFESDGSGPLSSMHIDAGAFCRLRPQDAWPTAQLFFTPGYTGRYPGAENAFTV